MLRNPNFSSISRSLLANVSVQLGHIFLMILSLNLITFLFFPFRFFSVPKEWESYFTQYLKMRLFFSGF